MTVSDASVAAAGCDAADDDRILPFQVDALDVRGRVVRLGPTVDAILRRHAYPGAVSRLLGEAVALTVLIGTSLKFDGQLQLQTRSDGPVDMLVVDFSAPASVRAYARFNAERLAQHPLASPAELLGRGHLAFTIDQGPHMQRYQGLVPLEGQGLEEAAHQYFLRSEQIPTRVRLAVAEEHTPDGRRWRAGGLMVQFLPGSTERQRQAEFDPGDAPAGSSQPAFVEDDAWVEARSLVETVTDLELVDSCLSSESLLYRLFHERGVRVFAASSLVERCRCSSERILEMLRRFTVEDRQAMIGEDGTIGVTCEFCSVHYSFRPGELDYTSGTDN
ncbi:MAG TPA: Hsp33 family molecular chaperone [Beijerinckiaceae bacterium]|nr:Hsp33 family molecular chaperone [Beijerinckiaceae bacterium]